MAFVCQIPLQLMENHHVSPLLYDHHGRRGGGGGGSLPRRGMWSVEEHDRFLQALKRFPDGPWQQLALCIGTRSTRQVQTHAQKYFEKIRRRQRGLQRSYVHSGTVREHRVDDDVVALLSSPALNGEGDAEGGDDEEKGERCDDDNGSSQEERSENSNTTNNASSSPRVRSSRDAKSPGSQPPLPRRIRIRRSARNALRVATHDGLFLQTLLATETSSSSYHKTGADETMADAPLALPTIEEALDFFLSTMDTSEPYPTTTTNSFLSVGI